VLALVGVVLALDLGWALSGADTGSLLYGLIDEPAHLATCAIALILLALCRRAPAPTFAAAALVASVAIDLDHVPQHLGFDFLTAGTARPYFHCALAVLVPLAAAIFLPRWRPLLLGVAFGVAAHLARDLVTGPGVPLALPFSDASVRLPYLLYAGGLVAVALACLLPAPGPKPRAKPQATRPAPGGQR
jgi:inner membrane protein